MNMLILNSFRHEEILQGEIIQSENGFRLYLPDNILCVQLIHGTQHWYKNDKRHRDEGPAVIYADGTQEWYKNGKHHREDGPAVIYFSGRQEWWINGKRHREDGPAVIYPSGMQFWFINGIRFTKEQFDEYVNSK